jgi:coenzyme F420-dependent glucose-6-phosphate dehydrogenase
VDAAFDHVALHQVGPDQDGFLDFWRKELRSALEQQKIARL